MSERRFEPDAPPSGHGSLPGESARQAGGKPVIVPDSVTKRRTYPWTTRLADLDITFRLMTAADGETVRSFALGLAEYDLLFLRLDITKKESIATWIRNIDSGKTVTVLAEAGGRLAGYCSLHQSDILWTRHLGELRLLVSSEYRGKGIGGQLARQICAIAQDHGQFQKLMAQMMSTQHDAQNLFHRLGFIPEAMLHDWVIARNGRTHDLIVMSREVDQVELETDET